VKVGDMSDLEKTRAITFLSLLGATLILLFALRSDFDPRTQHTIDPLQLCAVTKGALCDDPQPGARHASSFEVVELGQMVVTASRATTIADLGALTVTASRLARVADLGSMTITAPRATLAQARPASAAGFQTAI
jgi:hypothetical protein